MPNVTKDVVRKALTGVAVAGAKDLVAGGHVRHIAVCDGMVTVDLVLPDTGGEAAGAIAEKARAAVRAVEGVNPEQVRIHVSSGGSPEPVEDSGVTGVKHVVSIGSGKGGVGKSTVTVNIAVTLARQGCAVGLLDMDVYGPSIPLMLGKKEMPQSDGQSMMPIEAHGIRFMSMGLLVPDDKPVIWRGPMLHGAVQQFLKQVAWGELDYLLVDLPPGTGDVHLSLVQMIKLAGSVVVSTPQPVSLLDAGKALRMFQETGSRILGLIENMSYYVCPGCERKDYIFGQGGVKKAAKKFGVPFMGEIPLIAKIRETGDAGSPIAAIDPDSVAGQAYAHVAAELVEQVRSIGGDGPKRGSLKIK